MNEERLRNVVKALRESPAPLNFTMSYWGQGCGSPACAMGHYAFREDLQDVYILNELGDIQKVDRVVSEILQLPFESFAKHFDLSQQETMALFGSNGCNKAKTIEEAIAYIEDFITEKLGVKEAVEELIEEEMVLK